MRESKTDCETFEILISAMVDGELTKIEYGELNDHLDSCECCSRRVMRFEEINSAVFGLSDPVFGCPIEADEISDRVVPASIHRRQEPVPPLDQRARRKLYSIWSMLPLAFVASVVVCLIIVALPNGEPVAADQISPSEIVDPIRELHIIHTQQQRDQELMLRTLGMDLRSLKLELNRLEEGSPEREALANQIDALLEKVVAFAEQGKSGRTPDATD